MAWSFDVNGTVPAGGAEIMFRLKTILKTQGWTVPRSSDGSTYNASGDQITQAGTGVGGMDVSRAWFVIASPSGSRQYCFQRGTADSASWRIKYSGTAGFTGGSPAATVVPSATDEQVLTGGGTDASPSFTAIVDGLGLNRVFIIAGGESESHSFLIWWQKFGVYGPSYYFGVDVMQPGSYHASDTDPAVVLVGALNNSSNLTSDLNAGFGTTARSWFRKGFSDATFQNVVTLNHAYNSTTSVINQINGFPYGDNKDALYYVTWARPLALSPPAGVKGLSTLFRWNGRWRGYGATLTVDSTRDWIQIGGSNELNYFSVPWNGSKAALKE